MRPDLIAFCASVVFLGISLAVTQQKEAAAKVSKSDPSVYAELNKVPEKARVRRNPMETDPDAVAAGRNLFERHCAECHGDTAEGGRKAPSLRAEEVQNSTAGAIFWILSNGVVRRGMPVWSKLPEPQRWQLVTYIKSLGVRLTQPANPSLPKADLTPLTAPASPPH